MFKISSLILFLTVSLFANDGCFGLKAEFGSALSIFEQQDKQETKKEPNKIKNTKSNKVVNQTRLLNLANRNFSRKLYSANTPKIMYLSNLPFYQKQLYKAYPMVAKEYKINKLNKQQISQKAAKVKSDIVLIQTYNGKYESYYYLKDIAK